MKSWVEDLLYRFLGPETTPEEHRHERVVAREVVRKCAELAREANQPELAQRILELLQS